MAQLIKELSEINAVSGNENAIRELILNKIKAMDFQVSVDNMGNITAKKSGSKADKRLMLVTHMDECGFIVSNITDKGYISFKAVGDIDVNTVISKRVVIGENNIKGIIGMKAIHLQTKEERENTVPLKKLFIDIGAKDKREAEKLVKIGDFIAFDTKFKEVSDKYLGKAMSRIGVYVLLSLMEKINNEAYFVFTSQKEVGMRGAKIVSRQIKPDVVITIGTAAAEDMFGAEEKTVMLGKGAVIPVMDKNVIYDRRLIDKAVKIAEDMKLPYQKMVMKNEYSDAGAVQTAATGASCINASIPCRYAKTPVEMICKNDINAVTELLKAFAENVCC